MASFELLLSDNTDSRKNYLSAVAESGTCAHGEALSVIIFPLHPDALAGAAYLVMLSVRT
ncbi:hypothetical protein [Achromobacter xylosoxidans]|uniref:hypothetical protein n=1 Tax=Alcaligenes xylosoxydans xylosoxydans TaxID=85698 RepID=UPI00192BEA10|nr:hypothetical protein [Achromobacter xylosoxidans]